jgi:polysaccharide deacetylase family protein (PEP-CTERM system associated)
MILLSVDLEDPRLDSRDGMRYPSRVEKNTLNILEFLGRHSVRCTFFTVGNVFREFPDVVHEVVRRGHELAWHSDRHLPVKHMNRSEFQEDLRLAKAWEQKLGCAIAGYRAPMFSVSKEQFWIHEELARAGFAYSSSVLPAANPLHGWAGFGVSPRRVGSVLEIPMRTIRVGPLAVPVGGVYFRVLPKSWVFNGVRKMFDTRQTVPTYFHPYDFDPDEEFYLHGGIGSNPFYNWLLYLNRKNTFDRLDSLIRLGIPTGTYGDFERTFD